MEENRANSPRESPLQCGGASVGSRIPKLAHIAQRTPQGISIVYFACGRVANRQCGVAEGLTFWKLKHLRFNLLWSQGVKLIENAVA